MSPRLRRACPALLVLACLSAGPPQAAAGEGTMTCYNTLADNDRDGYADAKATGLELNRRDGLHCPDPGTWVDKGGDCNDHNPNVHPRADEIGGNGIDDNCSVNEQSETNRIGKIDEPVVYYSTNSEMAFDRAPTSFGMVVRMNDDVLAGFASRGLTIRAEIEYAALDSSLHLARRVVPVSADYGAPFAHFTVPDLRPDMVYRVQARFTSCALYAVTEGCRVTPWSNYYYGATGSYSSLGELRARMVSSALYQANESRYQLVGYLGPNGSQDGKRFGADYGEQWCTEFYSWVYAPYVGTWGYGKRPTTVDGMISHFGIFNRLTPPSDIPWVGRRGDYLAIDSDNDGSLNHSGMFLAWDFDLNLMHTVEGNRGNEVGFGLRPTWPDIGWLGRITY